jgi:SH3 domain (SH3b1 type)/NLPC_P60 stabilising domain, N term/NlpC/P60 family
LVALAGGLAACAGPAGSIADLRDIPQDPAALLAGADAQACLLQPRYQAAQDAEFNRRYFSCWQRAAPANGRQEIAALAAPMLERPGKGENLLPRPRSWYLALLAQADLARYPSLDWPGVTIAPADLRVLPTARPDFAGSGPGEGFPFDRLQQTALPLGLPVRVWHQSRDGAWLLVASPLAAGWLPVGAVARAGPRFRARWQSGRYLAVIEDDALLRSVQGHALGTVPLGAVLPLLGAKACGWRVLAPVAVAGEARAVEARLAREAGAAKPLPFNLGNLTRLAGRLLGQPYGWGGLYGDRDCSALTRDLLAPFGLWLPRNSAQQARAGVEQVDLAGLSDAEKERLIQERGAPYLTLLYMPGHVMLYIGSPQGRPLVLHSIWGLKTSGSWCSQGRAIIGRTVITSLTPGAERPDLARPQGLLLHRLQSMVLLAPTAARCPAAGR